MSRYADRVRIEAEAQARRAAEEKEALARGVIPRQLVVAAPLQKVAHQTAEKLAEMTGATILILAKIGDDITLVGAQPSSQPLAEPDVRRTLLQTLLHLTPQAAPTLVSPPGA